MINPQENSFEFVELIKYFKHTKRLCSSIILLFTGNFSVLAQCNLLGQYSGNTGSNMSVMFLPDFISLLPVTE